MKRFIIHLIVGFISLYLATLFISGVTIQGVEESIKMTIFAGIVLGIVNTFIKPIVDVITIPLKLITLGLFGLVVNMLMVWIVDILFPSLIIQGIVPLFWTGLLVWILNSIGAKLAEK